MSNASYFEKVGFSFLMGHTFHSPDNSKKNKKYDYICGNRGEHIGPHALFVPLQEWKYKLLEFFCVAYYQSMFPNFIL